MSKPTFVMVVTDSSSNSIFANQVVAPLQQLAATGNYREIIIISLEQQQINSSKQEERISNNTTPIRLLLRRRPPLIPWLCIWYCKRQLRSIFTTITGTYTVRCRGAVAAIMTAAAITKQCSGITVQARGLLAEEYWLSAMTKKNVVTYCIALLRYYYLLSLEWRGYRCGPIEAVSEALSIYLQQRFGIAPTAITIATYDHPAPITPATKMAWRATIRTTLAIDATTPILVYSGSITAWQETTLVVQPCIAWLTKRPSGKVLVLTPHVQDFMQAIKQSVMHDNNVRNAFICKQVSAAEHRQYLAAADEALLVREEHIVNWVSRPTKVLEYRAAGLTVLHNNSVDWVIKTVGRCNQFPT